MAREPRSKPQGINAVARLAKVSPSTVSRVMNGKTTVDPEIAERVWRSARELDYTPSPLARSLVLGRTMTVAVLVPDLANPTFQDIMRGVSRAAAVDGYRLLVAESGEVASEEAILATEVRRRCDGVVLVSPRMDEEQLVRVVDDLAPVVVINRDSSRIDAPVLTADYEAGIQPLALHLYSLGHRRIAYLAGNPQSASNTLRVSGLAAFQRAHPDVELVTLPGGVGFDHGHQAAPSVVDARVTAVLAFNDLVAMGLLSGLGELGVAVPGDVSVTGFDDIPFARYTTPPLTTASVPVVEIGQQAWRRLHAVILGEAPEHNVDFRPRTEVRGSTGPAPARASG